MFLLLVINAMSFELPEVINLRQEDCDVYIGRGSRWGNPFVVGEHGTRDNVILKYEKYLMDKIQSGEITKQSLKSLSGKTLGCYCKPDKCHGDVIVKLFKETFIDDKL